MRRIGIRAVAGLLVIAWFATLQSVALADKRVKAVHVLAAVEQDAGARRALAIDVEAGAAQVGQVNLIAVRDVAGKVHQVIGVARDRRQFAHLRIPSPFANTQPAATEIVSGS